MEAAGGKQYVQLLQKGLAGVDAKSGKLLWKWNKSVSKYGANIPSPLFADGVVYAAAAGTGGALDRAPVRQAEAGLRASNGNLSSARGTRLPSLALSSDYAKIAFPDDVFGLKKFLTDWTVAVRVKVPLFTGGALRSDVLAAEAARDDAALRLRQATEVATREAEALQLELQGAEASWAASSGTAEQAARAYGITEVRVRNGLSTLTDLAEARLQLQQAEANRAQAARDLQVTRLRVALLRDLPFGTATTGGF